MLFYISLNYTNKKEDIFKKQALKRSGILLDPFHLKLNYHGFLIELVYIFSSELGYIFSSEDEGNQTHMTTTIHFYPKIIEGMEKYFVDKKIDKNQKQTDEGYKRKFGVHIEGLKSILNKDFVNFKHKFILEGANLPYSTIFLSDSFQQKLIELTKFKFYPLIKLKEDKIIVDFYMILEKEEQLDKIINLLFAFCDKLGESFSLHVDK